MRLFELGALPKEAGIATLEWSGEHPSRKGGKIHLPPYTGVEYFPLKGGEQFLFRIPYQDGERLYFGGTDEQPFLVEMKPAVLKALNKGEAGFYELIKPEGAKSCEEMFGTKAVRQGDWFAVPIPLNWGSVHGLLALFSGDDGRHEIAKEGGISVGETRHLLVDGPLVRLPNNSLRCACIAEGILRAPDHEDRILKGPHALFQTAHLKDPAQAD